MTARFETALAAYVAASSEGEPNHVASRELFDALDEAYFLRRAKKMDGKTYTSLAARYDEAIRKYAR